MSVRKPLEKAKRASVDIDALIEKGAKVKEDHKQNKDWTNINVRISVKLLEEIDEAVSNRVGITRTGWILESLNEKVQSLNQLPNLDLR